jgi:hypothetical protein
MKNTHPAVGRFGLMNTSLNANRKTPAGPFHSLKATQLFKNTRGWQR